MKERLKDAFRNFFIIVTLINLAMFVIGLIFAPEQKFGYEAFFYPIMYGLLSLIPSLVIGKSKEATFKQTVVREIVGIALIIVILLSVMFGGRPVTKETVIVALAVAGSIIVVSVGVNIVTWILDSKTAKEMTDDLKAFQEKMGDKDGEI
ncbi:MAG: hypothetical protein IKY04_00600 [Lachnospiraceae bacterium]|nr:hypothetical protein [Lachnospiraceae bacterium]